MKSKEQLEIVLSAKRQEFAAVRERIDGLNVWITANNLFKPDNTKFLESLFTEKANENTRSIQLQAQIDLVKWCLDE